LSLDTNHKIEPWIVEQTEELKDCRIFTLNREIVRSPATGKRGEFFILDSPDWVNIIPVTADGQIVFVAQYRLGSRQISLETPAGLINPGEAVEAAAARELREETGYTARSWKVLGHTYANPAFMTNHFTAVVAEDVTLTDPTAWDEHEELEMRLISSDQVADLIATGAVDNSFSVLALSWYLLYKQGVLQPRG
jgi:8-oxo-dGTP pyrophosphatase MutT (NUDIX family)